MEVKIGIQQAQRELTVDVGETAETVEKLIAEALAGPDGLLKLTDAKGKRVIVPGAKLAYVEIGSASSGAVGFRS